MRRLLRILKYATYPFLALSLLLLLGMAFGAAFVTDFTVENRTGDTIVVTPVGTVGPDGRRVPLPVKMLAWPSVSAFRSGGYRLAPGACVRIQYDMDDINFSEIVVAAAAEPRRTLQLVTNPNPTTNQYRGPMQPCYVIDDLTGLEAAPPAMQAAARAADRQWVIAVVELSLVLGPWVAYAIISRMARRGGGPS